MMIQVKELVKEFIVIKKEKGLRGAIRGLIRPKKTVIKAVDNISFVIEPGEIVGYVGPNGAGKSTTIKLLCGILHPTKGAVFINGLSPHENRQEVVQKMGVVFGQRTQLYWDLRLGETFELLKRIYRIDDKTYKENLGLMNDVLHINELEDIPVRQLSLGQRMRGDLAAAILHSPLILFLDEPTIGLDIESKQSIRQFILELNRFKKTTVILTTHDLDDVEYLCRRLLVINKGKIIKDGPLKILVDQLVPYRILQIELNTEDAEISHPSAEVTKQEGRQVWLRFDTKKISTPKLISDLSRNYPIHDLSVKDPNIEDVIKKIYEDSG